MSANKPNEKVYDYIIIGAGPAGCFCAIQLVQAKKSVLVLEKNAEGESKVCGDGISVRCVELLRKLQFPLERFGENGAAPIRKRIAVKNGGRQVEYYGKTDDKLSFGIPRYKTDEIFRAYAAEKGVEIVYRAKVGEISKSKKIFSVGGYLSKNVIAACGAFSALSVNKKKVRFNAADMAAGISATVTCKSQAEPCFLFDYDKKYMGQYAWIFKTDGDNWKVGVWLRSNKSKLKEYFYEFLRDKLPEYLGADFELTEPPKGAVMAIKAEGARRKTIVKPRVKGLYFIGDADMTSDEYNGEGITQAIFSGVMLAVKLTA